MNQAMTQGADRTGDWMMTASGRRFWPLDPRIGDVDFRDIGHALSLTCRYGGHVRRFYSVAEHCVLLALHFEKTGRVDLARHALLHDASEAYIGDVIRPLKRMLPQYAEIERRIERTIYEAAGLAPECPREVAEADSRIIADEAVQLFDEEAMLQADWAFAHGALRVTLLSLEPHQAEVLFATAFRRLLPAVAWA